MPEIYKQNIKRAVKNVIAHGDTDVFPFSFENVVMRKSQETFVQLIEDLSGNFDVDIEALPPQFESTLVPAGYNGYRWVTQIDPFWNSYLLSAVIRHGDDIEKSRLPTQDRHVHSYRFDSDEESESLFKSEYNWHRFMVESYGRAHSSNFVVITDISEFYRRIYHHRVENSLERVCTTNVPDKIIKLLSKFSMGTSYGVPVGGPAARIIAEMTLDQIDHLLLARGISFCRFVDDFHIFSESEQDAYKAIQVLSELLILNQGLNLQKSKTRILPSSEFINTFPEHLKPNSTPRTDRDRLFSLALNYDPYSPNAEEDYEALKLSLEEIDFLSLLNEELSKSQVHAPTIAKLIKSLRVTGGKVRSQAIATLMSNINILYPVLSQLLIVVYGIRNALTPEEYKIICENLINLIMVNSYLMELDVHKCYAVRILAQHQDYRVDAIFTKWLKDGSPLVKRDVIIGFVARGGWYHLSDFKTRVAGETPWVRRAMIVASYGLGDEGRHWRQAQNFNRFEKFTRDCISQTPTANLGDLL
jgi:hypothetical protein